jgi:hypothetical protein
LPPEVEALALRPEGEDPGRDPAEQAVGHQAVAGTSVQAASLEVGDRHVPELGPTTLEIHEK